MLFISNVLLDKPGKPDAPEITSVSDGKVSLSWKPPKEDGGAEITNYIVEYKTEDAFKWLRANKNDVSETKYTVKGLDNDNMYEFRITAENKAGAGPPSEPSSPVKAVEPVGKKKEIYSQCPHC